MAVARQREACKKLSLQQCKINARLRKWCEVQPHNSCDVSALYALRLSYRQPNAPDHEQLRAVGVLEQHPVRAAEATGNWRFFAIGAGVVVAWLAFESLMRRGTEHDIDPYAAEGQRLIERKRYERPASRTRPIVERVRIVDTEHDMELSNPRRRTSAGGATHHLVPRVSAAAAAAASARGTGTGTHAPALYLA